MVFSEESQKKKKKDFKKMGKNQLLQKGTDMNFDIGVSACGAIGDNQARKLDIKRVYTHVNPGTRVGLNRATTATFQ
jgi:hypothetical protein